MKLKIYAISVTVLLVLIVACGGGSKSTPPPPSAQSHSQVFSSTEGQQILPNSHSQSTASNFSFDLIPKVYAQTALTATSSISGHCALISPTSPQYTQTGEYILYGAGRWDSAANCNSSGTDQGFILGAANTYIPTNLDGATVFVPGTAYKLQVSTSSKSSFLSATGGRVNVYIQRNGQVTTLPLTCTIGQGNTQCSDDGNSSGHTFALQAADQVYMVVVLSPGESIRNFRVLLSIA